jgi:hypothetical protein
MPARHDRAYVSGWPRTGTDRAADGGCELTRGEVDRTVRAAAAGLIELGVAEKARVGIIGANRPEWTLADLDPVGSRQPVPIHPTSPLPSRPHRVPRRPAVRRCGRSLQTARDCGRAPPGEAVCFDGQPANPAAFGDELGTERGVRRGRPRSKSGSSVIGRTR